MVMAYPGPPRRKTGVVRTILLTVFILSAIYYLRRGAPRVPTFEGLDLTTAHLPTTPQNPSADLEMKPPVEPPAKEVPVKEEPVKETPVTKPDAKPDVKPDASPVAEAKGSHPIDTLIAAAELEFNAVLKKESHDLKTAAAVYRERRGRHPPPGFDEWFKFAQDNNAVMVEDFFDQIYHDLNPFWGLPAKVMRKEGWDHEMAINIRDKKASAGSTWFWTQIWLNMTQTIEHLLPDMDIPLNAMDEPRVVAPWEKISEYMEIERKERAMPPAADVVSKFQKLPPPTEGDKDVETREKNWEQTRPFWKVASRGCPPDSLSRKADTETDFDHPPHISLAHTLSHSYKGFVSNYSLSTDFCHQPDLQSLHGMMINPLSVSATATLFPIFGGSKLHTNNEILLPAPMYWNNEVRFSGGDDHGDPWDQKAEKVVWRGVATGGLNTPKNWKGFQRHRFVALTNGTKISGAESWQHIPENWALPSSQYNLAAQEENKLGEWTSKWADTGFVGLQCENEVPDDQCTYVTPYYKVLEGVPMSQQFDSKYIPDIDGNSFSGRYRGFLLSTSLPIKATIFREWHDSRLFAWKHFVPMDNRFTDFHAIMEYFLGYDGERVKVKGHDKAAEKIALAGQEWANKVLRPEDMQIYVLRLLLEYARLGHDNRANLGYVKDLL